MAGFPKSDQQRRLSFGPFSVDLRAGELYKGKKKVKVQQLPLQVLGALLESPGQVVQREELKSRLWPADTFVDFEHGLNTAITKLRQALADDADNPRFIETLPRRGYRFLVPVTNGGSGAALTGVAPTSTGLAPEAEQANSTAWAGALQHQIPRSTLYWAL